MYFCSSWDPATADPNPTSVSVWSLSLEWFPNVLVRVPIKTMRPPLQRLVMKESVALQLYSCMLPSCRRLSDFCLCPARKSNHSETNTRVMIKKIADLLRRTWGNPGCHILSQDHEHPYKRLLLTCHNVCGRWKFRLDSKL